MHAEIARFLRPKDALHMTATCAQLTSPQACHTWYASEELCLEWRLNLQSHTLAALLRRLQHVTALSCDSTARINDVTPLTIAISLGLCKHLRELSLHDYAIAALPTSTFEYLGTAIEANTLPVLEELTIDGMWGDGGVRHLLPAFSKGACPRLYMLDIPFRCSKIEEDEDEDEDGYDSDDEFDEEQTEMNIASLAVLLETRNGLGFCAQLKELPDDVLKYASSDVKIRLLLATSNSLETLWLADGVLDDETCARLASLIESKQLLFPQLTKVTFYHAFEGPDGAAGLFHSVGNGTALNSVCSLSILEENLSMDACHALGSTFEKDALPNLESYSLAVSPIGTRGLTILLSGLIKSRCAYKLRELHLRNCGIDAEGAKRLGLIIGRDSLPSLQHLSLSSNTKLGDDGVAYLLQGMQASSRLKITNLELGSVGMGNVGLKFLAEAIGSSTFVNVSSLDASANPAIHNIMPLMNVLRSGRLRNLTRFEMSSINIDQGEVTTLAHTLMENCPALKSIWLPKAGPGTRRAIDTHKKSLGRGRELSIWCL
jgi:hypothetical protein